jgi:hypothetical protein
MDCQALRLRDDGTHPMMLPRGQKRPYVEKATASLAGLVSSPKTEWSTAALPEQMPAGTFQANQPGDMNDMQKKDDTNLLLAIGG